MNQFVTIRQLVLLDKMEIYVNDELRGSWDADFSEINSPIKIFSPDLRPSPTITVKSVHIRVPSKTITEKPTIPSDASEYKGHHYLFVHEPLTWIKAKSDAEAKGGYLVMLKDKQELEFVTKLIQKARNLPRGSEAWAFVGASYEKQRWLWLDGTSVDSNFWGAQYKTAPTTSPDGVAMLDTINGIRPSYRSSSRHYVIEWDE